MLLEERRNFPPYFVNAGISEISNIPLPEYEEVICASRFKFDALTT